MIVQMGTFGNVEGRLEESCTGWKRASEKGPGSSSQTCQFRKSLSLLIGGVRDYNSTKKSSNWGSVNTRLWTGSCFVENCAK